MFLLYACTPAVLAGVAQWAAGVLLCVDTGLDSNLLGPSTCT